MQKTSEVSILLGKLLSITLYKKYEDISILLGFTMRDTGHLVCHCFLLPRVETNNEKELEVADLEC